MAVELLGRALGSALNDNSFLLKMLVQVQLFQGNERDEVQQINN